MRLCSPTLPMHDISLVIKTGYRDNQTGCTRYIQEIRKQFFDHRFFRFPIIIVTPVYKMEKRKIH